MDTDESRQQPATEFPNKERGPGALRGEVWLTLQTRQAQQLVRGRKGSIDKPAIIGLVGFADRLRMIWQAARDDDPYADWWLLKVHEAIEHARQMIFTQQQQLDTQLEQLTAMEVTLASSTRPYRIPLQFANPYAYLGAQLIAEFDTLSRTVLTGCHIGLLESKDAECLLHRCARKIRGTFVFTQGYSFMVIDRPAVLKGTGKAVRARDAMGNIPDDVLSGERRAPLVPRKRQFPTGVSEVKHLQARPPDEDSSRNDKNDDAGGI